MNMFQLLQPAQQQHLSLCENKHNSTHTRTHIDS
jgi:hypothetical protein